MTDRIEYITTPREFSAALSQKRNEPTLNAHHNRAELLEGKLGRGPVTLGELQEAAEAIKLDVTDAELKFARGICKKVVV